MKVSPKTRIKGKNLALMTARIAIDKTLYTMQYSPPCVVIAMQAVMVTQMAKLATIPSSCFRANGTIDKRRNKKISMV